MTYRYFIAKKVYICSQILCMAVLFRTNKHIHHRRTYVDP